MKCEMCKTEQVYIALFHHRVCDLCYNCLKYDYIDPEDIHISLPKINITGQYILYLDKDEAEFCFFEREDGKISFTHIEKGEHVHTSEWKEPEKMREYWKRLRSDGAKRKK